MPVRIYFVVHYKVGTNDIFFCKTVFYIFRARDIKNLGIDKLRRQENASLMRYVPRGNPPEFNASKDDCVVRQLIQEAAKPFFVLN